MVKMTFLRTIKYEGVLHPANSPVMVKEADVDELKKIGGIVIAEAKVETKKVENKLEDKVEEAVAEAKKSKAEVKEAPAKEKLPPTKGRKRG